MMFFPPSFQDNVCTHVDSSRHLFASPQCLGYFNEYGTVTKELCAPPKDVMKKQLKKIVKKIKAKAVFVATDSDAMINELQKAVKVRDFFFFSNFWYEINI